MRPVMHFMRCVTVLCVPALIGTAAAAQLDSGTGVQASREVDTPPPPFHAKPAGHGTSQVRPKPVSPKPHAVQPGTGPAPAAPH